MTEFEELLSGRTFAQELLRFSMITGLASQSLLKNLRASSGVFSGRFKVSLVPSLPDEVSMCKCVWFCSQSLVCFRCVPLLLLQSSERLPYLELGDRNLRALRPF